MWVDLHGRDEVCMVAVGGFCCNPMGCVRGCRNGLGIWMRGNCIGLNVAQ